VTGQHSYAFIRYRLFDSVEKLIVSKLASRLPVLYGARWFVTVFEPAIGLHPKPAQSNPHPRVLFFHIHLILFSHPRLGHPNDVFPLGSPSQKTFFPSHACHMLCPSYVLYSSICRVLCSLSVCLSVAISAPDTHAFSL
jgi:hypothetical protein